MERIIRIGRSTVRTAMFIFVLLGYTKSSDPSLDWETTIPWLRQHTKLPIWLKGG